MRTPARVVGHNRKAHGKKTPATDRTADQNKHVNGKTSRNVSRDVQHAIQERTSKAQNPDFGQYRSQRSAQSRRYEILFRQKTVQDLRTR